MTTAHVFLAGGVRTPIGRFGGSMANLSAPDLGVTAATAALARAGVPATAIDETIFGHGRQAGQGPGTGRQVSVRAGVPVEVPAWTVNMACGSSLKAVVLGAEATVQLSVLPLLTAVAFVEPLPIESKVTVTD